MAAMADRVEAQYRAANARNGFSGWPVARVAALVAMQEAYVAYVRAYAARYPAEAHLLPDGFRGRQLPEFEAYRAARDHAERVAA
jgi:hypothetical protein